MRVVMDTNVIVSALVFGGVPRQVLELAADGAYSFYFSPSIRSETERILKEKFGWHRDEIGLRLGVFWGWGIEVDPKVPLVVIAEDPDDDRILECALEARARVIVSGDHHLLRLGSFRSVRIQSPREFLDSKAWERIQ
jgi:putative PIN family toxin of toxin-antitoxin system